MEKDSEKIREKIVETDKIHPRVIQSFYSNGFSLGISKDEISIDFIQNPPDGEGNVYSSRIIISPRKFKKFLKVFNEVLSDYEKKHGKITISEEKKPVKKETKKKK